MNRITLLDRRSHRQVAQTRSVILSLVGAITFDLISFGSGIDALRPDLALLVMFYWSTRARSPANIGTAWCIGLLRDIATLTPLGLNAALYCLTAWVGVGLRKRLEAMPIPGELLLVLLVLLGGSMLALGVGLALGANPLAQTHLIAPLIGTLCWPLVRAVLQNLPFRRRKIARDD